MEEKKEQLKLTKSRWKLLRKHIGKNIINTFQKISLKNEEENQKNEYDYSTESFEILSDDEFQIEQILMEAGAYGLRNEVKEKAEKIFKENDMFSRLDAYVSAYHKIIEDND